MEWEKFKKIIIELNKAGYSQYEIANKLGAKQSTLNKACKRLNIKLQKNYPYGQKHYLYKGYRTHDGADYIVIRLPNGTSIREHRLVMQKHLGRKLKEDELIHHIDGNRKNNAFENLELISRSNHKKKHPDIGIKTRFQKTNESKRI